MLDLVVVTARGVVGEKNLVAEGKTKQCYMTSCICVSQVADVYEILVEDFKNQLNKIGCWSQIANIL